MGRPREIDHIVLGDQGFTEALYNHRAAMFKPDDSLLGFSGYVSDQQRNQFFQGAMLISYAGNKLSELGRIEFENPFTDSVRDGREILLHTGERLIYIGDTLYYLQGGLLRSFDLRTLTPRASLRLSATIN